MTGCCERGNEPSVSINCGGISWPAEEMSIKEGYGSSN